MQPKIYWIDNLRGIACLMVVMIHTTTWYVTNAHSVSPVTWDIANVLNSASRVSVPLFFMISGYLFFGERSAQPRHFLRIGLCLLFYSTVALLYIALFTSINVELALKNLLQKPVFYHLWFFFAIAVIYLVSPLIQVKNVGGKMLLVNRPGFPGECFICELRLPDHRFRWKHNKLFLLLPVGYGPAFPAIVDCYTSPPT